MTREKNTTLLALVWAMTQCGGSERAVVATVTRLINSGQVRLCGAFTGARIEETTPPTAVFPSLPTPSGRRKADG